MYITLIITMVETTGKEPYGRVERPQAVHQSEHPLSGVARLYSAV